ncbi:MAG: hypothetical protein K0R17_1016 [Rariglobus sp.]|jgi:hypothetical protein|nr:hypothetical protein [Rariglobus sp.]
MATTTRGTAILKFGTYTIASRIVSDSDTGISGQKTLVDDESGQNVTHISGFGLEGQHTITVIPLAAAVAPEIDTVISYNGQAGVLLSLNKVNVRRQVEAWRMVIDFIPGITYAA